MSKIFYLVFIFPGFLIFTILKVFLRGFGKESDAFDKTLYSFFFNIPIFLLTVLLLNCKFVINILKKINKNFSGLEKIDQLPGYFFDDIMMLISLIIIIVIVVIIVALLWCLLVYIVEKINNNIREYKIFNYADVWNSNFVEETESIPVEIYKPTMDNEKLIVEGFLKATSVSLEEDIEFKIIKPNLFKKCKEKELLSEIEYVYYNTAKDIKIKVFKQDKIDEYLKKD